MTRRERSEPVRQQRSSAERYYAAEAQPQQAERTYARDSIHYNRTSQAREGVRTPRSRQERESGGYSNRTSSQSQAARTTTRQSRHTEYGSTQKDAYRTAQPERYHAQHSRDQYLNRSRNATQKKVSLKSIGIALAVVAALGVGVFLFVQGLPVTVAVNGVNEEIDGAKTIETVLSKGFASPQPGDFVAVDGSILEEGKGELVSVSYNGASTTDFDTKLKNGDSIEIADGADKVEPSQDTVETIPFATVQEGVGPLHVFEGAGVDGQRTTKIGDISGITITEDTVPVENIVYRRYYPDVGDDKVIALTFDDGPWPETTQQVLDILDQNGVKATFFVVGENISESNTAMVKKAHDAGHQISSHSFDHARGNGGSVNLGLMSSEEQINEIVKSYEVIAAATGVEPSHVLRAPGGNFDENCQHTLRPYVDAEIGWSIDTQDWRKPGVEAIVDQMKAARTGDVVLLHDGGGNREQTIEAIKEAIPYLKAQGFTFVTIDEMMAYPQQAQ